MIRYTYRVLQASWGVYVAIKGSVDLVAERVVPADSLRVGDLALVVRCAFRLGEAELECIEKGLELAKPLVGSFIRDGMVAFVAVDDIEIVETDFQSEGLACAVAGLVCTSFNVAPPHIDAQYDKATNRYIFDFSTTKGP